MFTDLVRRPVIVAPMAGGPTTSGLVTAAAEAGAVGFVATGYKSARVMRAELDAVTAATSEPFGVNVFVPGADPRFTATAVTRAFSGRPARELVNKFMVDHQDAPAAYPEINNATRPIRAAAAAAGDTDRMSLWAGLGYRAATTRPAGEVIDQLCRQVH